MKRLLSVLLLVFAFSYLGFAADVTLDMFEYATDDSAQAAYVSSGGTINSPVSQWKMNDNAATKVVIDSVGSNTGASQQNTEDINTTGKINGALTFNGSGDYVDCGSGGSLGIAGAITFAAWVKLSVKDRPGGIIAYVDTPDQKDFRLFVGSDNRAIVDYEVNDGGEQRVYSTTYLDTGQWYHIAAVYTPTGNNLKIFIDGIKETDTNQSYARTNTNQSLFLGRISDIFLNGLIDDARIYDFALTAGEVMGLYANNAGTEAENPTKDLQCYSESTIKQQGSYSLKGIAVQTDSLNDTLTRTVSPTIDLSGKDDWIFYIYSADRTGSQIKLGIHDSGGTTTESTPDVTDTGVWQKVTVDVSAVTDANKDAIDSIIITPVNADAANTFYLDNMYGTVAAPEVDHPTTAQLLLGGIWFVGEKKYSDWTRFKRGTTE